jgi:hypothetical protein
VDALVGQRILGRLPRDEVQLEQDVDPVPVRLGQRLERGAVRGVGLELP